MAESVISLLIRATNQASGPLRQVSQDLAKQKAEIKSLQAAEQARAATQRSNLARSRLAYAQEAAAANNSTRNQQALARAKEAATRATNQAEIAQKRHALALTQAGQEATRTGSALSQIGSAGAAAGSAAAGGMSGLLSVLGSVASMALKAGGAIAAIGTAGIAKSVSDASRSEMTQLGASTGLAALTTLDLPQASEFIRNFNTELARSAGPLPGITDDYIRLANSIADNIVPAFGDLTNAGNLQNFGSTLKSLSESFGFLGATSGTDAGLTSLALSRVLSGASEAELRRLKFFEDNPAFFAQLMKAMTEETDDLPGRLAAIKKTGERFITSDVKIAAAQTFEGLIQSLATQLFDPNTGLFGGLRDLFPERAGTQSILEAAKRSMKALFGDGGLFPQLGRLLEAAGINTDLFQGLFLGWENFNKWLENTRDFLKGFENIDQVIASLGGFTGMGQKLAEKVNEGIESIDAAAIGRSIGNALNLIGSFIRNLDWGLIAGKLGEGLASFLGTLEWENATAIVVAIAGPKLAAMLGAWLLKATAQSLAAATAANTATGAASGMGGGTANAVAGGAGAGALSKAGGTAGIAKVGLWGAAIAGILAIFTAPDWNQVGEEIKADAIKTKANLKKVLQAPADTLAGTAQNIGQSIANMQQSAQKWQSSVGQGFNNWATQTIASFTQWASQTGQTISTWVTTVQTGISTFTQNAWSSIQSGWNTVVSTVSSWMNNINSTVSNITTTIAANVRAIWTAIQAFVSSKFQEMSNFVSNIIDQIKSAIENAWNTLVDKARSFASSISNLADIGSIISDAWNSLVQRVQAFANTISGLAGGLTGGGGSTPQSFRIPAPTSPVFASTNNNISNPVSYNGGSIQIIVNPSPGMNESQLADMVIRRLNDRVRQERLAFGV